MYRPTRRRESTLRQRVDAGRRWRTVRQQRSDVARRTSRRVAALVTALAVVGAVLTVGHVSQAVVNGTGALGTPDDACEEAPAAETQSDDLELHVEEGEDGSLHHHYRKKKRGNPPPPADPCENEEGSGSGSGSGSGEGDPGSGVGSGSGSGSGSDNGGSGSGEGDPGAGGSGNGGPGEGGSGDGGSGEGGSGGKDDSDDGGLDIVGHGCDESDLVPHEGFQDGLRCADTEFGEVPSEELAATLLITDAPMWVGADEPFTIQVSTRNLVRDRFLPAAQGGYLRESSVLTEEGLVRGHFHLACRILDANVAPAPEPVPAFFVAIEDGGGGTEPDLVTIEIPGLSEPGMYQCTAWAGDASHRLPMSPRANQTPPVDSVRITVA